MTQRKLLGYLLPGILLVALGVSLLAGNANAQTPTPEPPTPTPTPGPNAVALTPSQRALSCGTSTQVSVSATQGSAAAPNGTTITLAANPGTVSPASVTTTNGAATFTYFAPPGAQGIATITATGLNTTGSVQISLFCGAGPGGGQIPGAVINQPVVQCFGGTANVTFSWTPVANAEVQYVDLSLANNGFAGGTFIGFGPLTGTTNSIQWNGLVAGQTHYWRVSAGVPGAGWVFSATGSFTPCGPQAPLGGTTYLCTGGGRATVFWNIPSPGFTPTATYVDITIFNNGFAPGTFIGSNATGQMHFNWTGILANTTHYWRVNHLGPSGWVQGGTGNFNAAC
jgi:hypothetical protein